jgi:hypothetical protein
MENTLAVELLKFYQHSHFTKRKKDSFFIN